MGEAKVCMYESETVNVVILPGPCTNCATSYYACVVLKCPLGQFWPWPP